MMILLPLTLMMGILLDMIRTEEVILQMVPHLPQKPQIAQQLTFALLSYYSEQYQYMQG